MEEELCHAESETEDSVQSYAEKYRKAIKDLDFETLKTLDKSRLKSCYQSHCSMPGCECVEDVSIYSRLEHGCVDPSVVEFFLENEMIEADDLMKLLYTWMRSSCDPDMDRIFIALQWAINNVPDVVRSYIDKDDQSGECYNTTLLHASTYGWSKFQERLVLMLINAGCDPFAKTVDGHTPFEVMLVHSYDKALERVAELYESKDKNDGRPTLLDVNARCVEKYDKTGRSNLQSLLYRFRYAKDRGDGLFESLRRTIKFMLNRGIDLNHEDDNGMNVTNYIYMYKYNKVDFFKGVVLPIPKNAKPHHKPIYTYLNPSPFAFALYDHRYDKTTGAVMDELRELISEYGMPTEEEIHCRFLMKKHQAEDGKVISFIDYSSNVEFKSLSSLSSWWYQKTDVEELFS